MTKRAMITIDDSPSPPHVKDEAEYEYEPSTPPPTTPKKARKTPSAASTPVSASKKTPGGETFQSQARTAKGRYMEMIIETGLKALNKKDVLAETGLSAAQQGELFRKDKGALRRAVGGFISGL